MSKALFEEGYATETEADQHKTEVNHHTTLYIRDMINLSNYTLEELREMIPGIEMNIEECDRKKASRFRREELVKHKEVVLKEISDRSQQIMVAELDKELDVIIIDEQKY